MTWPASDYLRARAFVTRRWPEIADDIDVCAVLDAARASWYPDLGCKWPSWWRWWLHSTATRHLAREQTRLRALDRMALQPGPEHGPSPDEQVDAARLWRLVPQLDPQPAAVVWHRAHGATLGEVGREIGRTRERARQIWLTALRKLRKTAKIDEDLTPAR